MSNNCKQNILNLQYSTKHPVEENCAFPHSSPQNTSTYKKWQWFNVFAGGDICLQGLYCNIC